ncbi:hypothetical protein [Candidatus Poriferisodalis sp.]|uniref:hypothetical protein n=1 Tax=Candidatus Poriferisodalis sp. TaxID=3101277 RepID=UPI003B5BDC30
MEPRARSVVGKIAAGIPAFVQMERNNRRVWALHQGVLSEGLTPTVPAVVLAQGWRGG